MTPSLAGRALVLPAALLALASACAHYRDVEQPPEQDLTRFGVVGVMEFSSPKQGAGLGAMASQQFLQRVLRGQPGVRVVPLGAPDAALASVGASQLDRNALVALGQKHGVNAVISGRVELTDGTPTVQLGGGLGMTVDVTATVTANLQECASGSTVWTDSARQQEQVGGLAVGRGGSISGSAQSPDEAYASVVRRAANRLASPFQPQWIRVRVD